MSLSAIAIRRPVFAWMLMSGLIIFGGVAFTRMGISQLPDVDFPVINIALTYEGAAPEVMETDVVDVIEGAVTTIEGVQQVTSTSRDGSANVSVQLDINRNVDLALQDVQAKIAEAQKNLPKEMDPPVITKVNPEDQPILWVTLESEKHTIRELSTYVRDHIQQEFATAQDVGDINLGGYIDPNLRVWVSSKELSKYQLTVSDVISTIQNEHSEPPSGTITEKNNEFSVRTLGEATTVEQFNELEISSRGGSPNFSPIPLKKVANMVEGLADIRRISRGVGKPAIGLGIRKQRGSNAVAVAEAVRKKIAQMETTLPEGMHLGINFDSTKFIKDSVNELNFTLILSALLTAFVCWAFLGSWSSTFNILLSIPTSIVGAFIVLYFSGFTLNTFTLMGLSLAIGIVVDDAIMVLENIIRHREMGKDRVTAALDGSKEITFAALAATLSIVAIFLPVAFMDGIIGKFFFQFGVTMTTAVLLSLVEALTLTPMRCAEFVDVGERTTKVGRGIEHLFELTMSLYARILKGALRYKYVVIFLSMVFFAASIYSVKKINKEFLPQEDQSRFLIRARTPIGSSIEFTDQKYKEIEGFLAKRSEVDRYFVSIGGSGDVTNGIVFVTLKDKGKRGLDPASGKELSQSEFMTMSRTALNKIPELIVSMQDLSMRGFTSSKGYPIEFTVQGPEWAQLGQLSKGIITELNKSGMVSDMDSDYLEGMPEVDIIPDRIKAAERGVSVATIGQTVSAMIGGEVVGRYEKAGHRDDIRVKILDEGLNRQELIKHLMVRNNRGEIIPLKDVVKISERKSLLSVSRRNRERAVTVFGNITKGASQQQILDNVKTIAAKTLPPGYRLVLTGSAEDFKATFNSLMLALVLGLIVAYMVLASQFNSFIDPLTVFAALPFSISGAFFALLVSGQSINMYSMIGLILLMGIVKKNSILLVDFTNQVRERGEAVVDRALLAACPVRLRPILMTSFATIAGAIPAALAFGPGAESRMPMAITVIGGVMVSTVLTLLVVPCVYAIFTKMERSKRKNHAL